MREKFLIQKSIKKKRIFDKNPNRGGMPASERNKVVKTMFIKPVVLKNLNSLRVLKILKSKRKNKQNIKKSKAV